jgi:endonuclease-3 related protein
MTLNYESIYIHPRADAITEFLLKTYQILLSHYGHQDWWPAENPFEVIVGAILTQSAAWTNVEKAIDNLKKIEPLTPAFLRRISPDELSNLIFPAGYHNAKTVKIKTFVEWLEEHYDNNLDKLFALDTPLLREELVSIYGIGEETADSIILYAAQKPVFVIDAYTRRVMHRLGIAPDINSYAEFQMLFMKHLPQDEQLFNEYHALFVCHGKLTCKRKPHCESCCLNGLCKFAWEKRDF